jgi:hypothetical protein
MYLATFPAAFLMAAKLIAVLVMVFKARIFQSSFTSR